MNNGRLPDRAEGREPGLRRAVVVHGGTEDDGVNRVAIGQRVFETFEHLYEKLEEGKKLIPPGQFHEMRYEELVNDPLGQMRLLYERLNLGDFDRVRPRLEDYLAKTKGYQTNKYERSPEVRAEIGRRWGEVIRRYGYAEPAE